MTDKPDFSVVLITDADVRSIAKRWERQYKKEAGWVEGRAPLKATTLDAIDAEIGNESWTRIRCDACRTYVRKTVHFSNYDSGVDICSDCACIIGALGKALRPWLRRSKDERPTTSHDR